MHITQSVEDQRKTAPFRREEICLQTELQYQLFPGSPACQPTVRILDFMNLLASTIM